MRDDAGFTVVEVLVTAVILVLLLGAVYTVFESGLNIWFQSERKVDRQQNVRIAVDRLTREIRNGRRLVDTDGKTYIEFEDYLGRTIRYYHDSAEEKVWRYVKGTNGRGTVVAYQITAVEFKFLSGRTVSVSMASGDYQVKTKVSLYNLD